MILRIALGIPAKGGCVTGSGCVVGLVRSGNEIGTSGLGGLWTGIFTVLTDVTVGGGGDVGAGGAELGLMHS